MNLMRFPNTTMKSSDPLFTRQNPFKSSSRLVNTHYHPSRTHSLSKTEKGMALSPVRFDQPTSSCLTTLNQKSQKMLGTQKSRSGVTNEQPAFTESWPAPTDFESSSSSSSTASHDMESIAYKVKPGKITISSEKRNWQELSDLSKSTEYFHDSPSQRREEHVEYTVDEQHLSFWQTSPTSVPPSSTPTKTADMDDYQSSIYSSAEGCLGDKCLSPSRDLPSILSESEADDTEMVHLQERANRLLLREERMNDGSIRVSSEDLGCTAFSSSNSIDDLQCRPLIPAKAWSDSQPAASSQKSVVPPSLVTPQQPEEDILFQWRLRRKMEQAREGPRNVQHPSLHVPTFGWQSQTFNHPAANGLLFKHQQSTQTEYSTHPRVMASQSEPHASCFHVPGPSPVPTFVASGSLDSQPRPVTSFPAHMHFLCDVLPCPIQSSHASGQQIIIPVISRSHVKSKVPENNPTDEPICEPGPHLQPASSEAVERGGTSHHKRPERKKKEKVWMKDSERVIATRKQKKSSVDREHVDAPGAVSESRWHERVTQQPEHQKSRRDISNAAAVQSSPIRTTLGQVVSEVLFPPSSPAQRSPAFSGSPAGPSSLPPQPSGPPHDTQNSVEVIAQLLQEAEDSDEKDFEDDPLLHVLRKQRAWIREQISQTDSVFSELLDEQPGTSTLMRDT